MGRLKAEKDKGLPTCNKQKCRRNSSNYTEDRYTRACLRCTAGLTKEECRNSGMFQKGEGV